MFDVQVEAPLHLAQLVIPGMRAKGQGWILNISSGAAELYDDNIAVNALSPNQVVPTAGTVFHHLTTEDDPNAEPPAVMAEAALLLCSSGPGTLTGRITYSQDLLTELNVATPAR